MVSLSHGPAAPLRLQTPHYGVSTGDCLSAQPSPRRAGRGTTQQQLRNADLARGAARRKLPIADFPQHFFNGINPAHGNAGFALRRVRIADFSPGAAYVLTPYIGLSAGAASESPHCGLTTCRRQCCYCFRPCSVESGLPQSPQSALAD